MECFSGMVIPDLNPAGRLQSTSVHYYGGPGLPTGNPWPQQFSLTRADAVFGGISSGLPRYSRSHRHLRASADGAGFPREAGPPADRVGSPGCPGHLPQNRTCAVHIRLFG